MHKIRDWLYIANFPEASSAKTVASHNIDAMLQLFEEFDNPDVETLYVEAIDGYPLSADRIKRGVDFVKQKHAEGKTVLVTCGAGVSRSVTFSIASLKEIEGLSLQEAYADIHSKHNDAMPDQIHWQSLTEYYDVDAPFWEIWKNVIMAEEEDE